MTPMRIGNQQASKKCINLNNGEIALIRPGKFDSKFGVWGKFASKTTSLRLPAENCLPPQGSSPQQSFYPRHPSKSDMRGGLSCKPRRCYCNRRGTAPCSIERGDDFSGRRNTCANQSPEPRWNRMGRSRGPSGASRWDRPKRSGRDLARPGAIAHTNAPSRTKLRATTPIELGRFGVGGPGGATLFGFASFGDIRFHHF